MVFSLAILLFSCGEVEESTDDQNDSQEQAEDDEECPLEYEIFCEDADCCPENCYALQGRAIDPEDQCYLDDEAHWCISPEIFTPGSELENNAAPDCHYDEETGFVLVTGSPADGLGSTGGPLVRCDSETEQESYDVEYGTYCD